MSTAGPQRPDRMPEDMPDRTPDSMSDSMPDVGTAANQAAAMKRQNRNLFAGYQGPSADGQWDFG